MANARAPRTVTIVTASQTGDSGSYADSTSGLDSVVINGNTRHPEHWTLPGELNIEKRELYDSWKMDVQHQVSYLDKKLCSSLSSHPDSALGRYNYLESHVDKVRRRQTDEEMRGKMGTGLRRN